MSLPPSPNRSSYLAESPPTLHPGSELHRIVTRLELSFNEYCLLLMDIQNYIFQRWINILNINKAY